MDHEEDKHCARLAQRNPQHCEEDTVDVEDIRDESLFRAPHDTLRRVQHSGDVYGQLRHRGEH